jgi:Putative prokaryotic signal transducing protein
MEPHNLVAVYLAPDSFKAELIKNMLEEEGIRAVVQTENSLVGADDVPVLVEDTQSEQARKLIEEYEDRVIADSLADLEKREDEGEEEPEGEEPAPAP